MMLNKPAFSIKEIPDVEGSKLIERNVFGDERGNFSELFRSDTPGLPNMVQQNQSFSFGGVLRGMHVQRDNPQGKLITCLYGTILDVIFDIRKGSPTFGQGLSITLDMSLNSLYCPPGCLHGFLALSRYAVVHYSCTSFYDSETDGGVRWDSPEIRKLFPEDIIPIMSRKDQELPYLQEYLEKHR